MDFFDRINFCKIVQLLAGGGTKVLRALAEDLSGPTTFKDYLYQNQSKVFEIKLSEDQRNLIIKRDVEKMDITLLHRLIMKLFKNKLTGTQFKIVNALKTERDQLVHSDLLETVKLNDKDFIHKWLDIETLFLKLSATIETAGVKGEMSEFIRTIRDTVPDFDEISDILREWFRSNSNKDHDIDKIDEILKQLRADVESYKLMNDEWSLTEYGLFREVFLSDYGRYKRSLKVPDPFDVDLKDITLDHINTSNIVVLQGEKGSGKTKGALSVVHKLILSGDIKEERCAEIRNPSDVKAVRPEDCDLLLIDGIANNPYMTPVWEESLRYLETLLGSSSMKIIITSREAINLEMKTAKGTFKLATRTVKIPDVESWPG